MNPVTSAIIFVNSDISTQVLEVLQRQLFIDEMITGTEFDDRLTSDPSYSEVIHQNDLKILVVRSFRELTNRDKADLVIFIKNGLAAVESTKFGPPAQTFAVDKLYWDQIVNGFPQGSLFYANPNVQDNIYYPLCPEPGIKLEPFGSNSVNYKKNIFEE